MLKKLAREWLGHRYLPAALALAGVLVMLPALKAGLGVDDLMQRVVELKPSELPPRIRDTGFALESGTLPVVLRDLFGFSGRPEMIARARNYGVLPWWTRQDLKAALWRPLTAFTHWLDYRLFPNSPELMHAQNIVWFAAIVFLVALVYRRLIRSEWVAGMAAVLFLLDKNTYFPVMFVANRGFVMSLCFGLLCLYAHHRWRSTGSRRAAALSALALAASLFANEAGASTLAFLLAYALFLERNDPNSSTASTTAEPRDIRASILAVATRLASLGPTVLVVLLWRVLYQGLGFGVAHVGAYIDPVREPLRFAAQAGARSMALLGGQVTGVAPDVVMALKPSLQVTFLALACAAAALFVAAVAPLLRADRVARFWFGAMLLAVIPAATVVPLSKNLGFVAAAAFGLIATFLAGFLTGKTWVPAAPLYRGLAWMVCGLLLLAHVPGAIVGRIAAVKTAPSALRLLNRLGDVGDPPGIGAQDIVVLNAPCQLAMMAAPFTRAYEGKALPGSLRSLTPGCTGFEIRRTEDRTLEVQSQGANIFHCGDVGLFHYAYIFNRVDWFMRQPAYCPGERARLTGLDAEVLQVDPQGLPARIAFHFRTSLDSPGLAWRYFDWSTFSYRKFEVPRVGQSVAVPGPKEVHWDKGLSSL